MKFYCFLGCFFFSISLWAFEVPFRAGWLTDTAGYFTTYERRSLESQLEAVAVRHQVPIDVVTLGETPEDLPEVSARLIRTTWWHHAQAPSLLLIDFNARDFYVVGTGSVDENFLRNSFRLGAYGPGLNSFLGIYSGDGSQNRHFFLMSHVIYLFVFVIGTVFACLFVLKKVLMPSGVTHETTQTII